MENNPRLAARNNPRARLSTPARNNPMHVRAARSENGPAQRNARRRPRALRLACATALVLAIALLGSRFLDTSEGALAPFRGEALSGDISTPVSEWTRGQVPRLYQTDPAWASEPYAGGTVEENGCGPTCMAAAYVAQTGKTDMDPAKMAAFSEENGFVESNMTTWLFMSEGAAMLGLRSEELPADEGILKAALAEGKTVICSVGPGDFTTEGHFIVISGTDSAGKLQVMDPNSAERSARSWDPERVIAQCRNIWAISA